MSDSKKIPVSIDAPSYLATVAIQMHEMYGELQRAGFTQKEALEIIGFIAASGVMEPPMYEEGPTMMPIHIQFEDGDIDDDDDLDEEDDNKGPQEPSMG